MSISRYNRFNSLKVLRHWDKMKMIFNDEIPSPAEWVVYPTNFCNYNCPHCIMRTERNTYRDKLSDFAMSKIPDDAKTYGISLVRFVGGGEPLMHPQTLETARLLRELGIKVAIDTNGSLLKDATNVDYLRISVDGASKETYQKIHGVDAWEKLNNNLDTYIRGNSELGLAFLVTPDNYHEIMQFAEWANSKNPNFAHIRPAWLPDRKEEMEIAMAEIARLKPIIEEKYDNIFIKTDNFAPRCYSKCRATPLKAVLAADGSFIVCQDVFIRFGNYNKESFEDIWWGEEHKKALKKIDVNNCPRCVESSYNEIIEKCVIGDDLRMDLI